MTALLYCRSWRGTHSKRVYFAERHVSRQYPCYLTNRSGSSEGRAETIQQHKAFLFIPPHASHGGQSKAMECLSPGRRRIKPFPKSISSEDGFNLIRHSPTPRLDLEGLNDQPSPELSSREGKHRGPPRPKIFYGTWHMPHNIVIGLNSITSTLWASNLLYCLLIAVAHKET